MSSVTPLFTLFLAFLVINQSLAAPIPKEEVGQVMKTSWSQVVNKFKEAFNEVKLFFYSLFFSAEQKAAFKSLKYANEEVKLTFEEIKAMSTENMTISEFLEALKKFKAIVFEHLEAAKSVYKAFNRDSILPEDLQEKYDDMQKQIEKYESKLDSPMEKV